MRSVPSRTLPRLSFNVFGKLFSAIICVRVVFLVLPYSGLQTPLYAQSVTITDSLQRALMLNPPDSIKVRLLNGLAWEYRGVQMLRALEYGRQALELATALGLEDDMINSYNFIGVSYRNMGSYAQAMSSYLKALELAEKIRNDKQIAYCYNNISNLYQKQKLYRPALENAMKALAAFERLSDKRGTAYSHLRIGEVYEKQQLNEQAVEHYQESLRLRKEIGDKEGLITPLINLATVYRQMGQDDRAFETYKQSLVIENELHQDKGLAGSLVGLGFLHLKRGDYQKAIIAAEESLTHSRKSSAIQEEMTALKLLTEAHSLKKDFAQAFHWQEAFIHLRDSLQNDETSSQIASLRSEYEAEKRAAEIMLLNKNRQMQNWLLSGAMAAIVAFAVLTISLFRLNKQRRKANRELRWQNDRTEEERRRSESLLLNILPAAIAERMKSGETTIAEYFDGATVLFADIVGFTTLASYLPPRELVGMLDSVFSDFDILAEKYGLEKIKTIGDSYMVVSGVPQPRTDHVERVALFALEAMLTMQKYTRIQSTASTNTDSAAILAQTSVETQSTAPLQLRIGIHTGSVIAGVIGKKKFAYDLWGDAVNIASRMEAHGMSGQIQVSEDVRKRLSDDGISQIHGFSQSQSRFRFEERGEIEVKGKGMMKTYFLHAA